MRTFQVVVGSHDEFAEHGFIVLPDFFAPAALSQEVDRALSDSAVSHQSFPAGSGSVSLRYVPMMSERTPLSVELTGKLAEVASELLARRVLPGRSKGTCYYGDTSWHRDSEHEVPSLACIAYLDVLTGSSGALRVLSGSHRDRNMSAPPDGSVAGTPVMSEPGDVIVFDEQLIHGSTGGKKRRQWRTDFIAAPTDAEVAAVRDWYGQSLPDEGDNPGYDARVYPSYGAAWRNRFPAWTAQLVALGVIPERR